MNSFVENSFFLQFFPTTLHVARYFTSDKKKHIFVHQTIRYRKIKTVFPFRKNHVNTVIIIENSCSLTY